MIQQGSFESINKELPIGYKKTKFGIFPDDWEVRKIKDILKRVRKPVDVQSNEEYKQIGIRSHGKGIFYKEPVSGEELGNKAVYWIEPGCFIVNIVFAWEMAVSKTTENELGFIASHRFPMYSPKKNMLDLDFITYLFKSTRGKYLLNLASPGGAGRNKTLGQKEFGELEVVIPRNVKEQKKIVEILLLWDKAIDLKEKLIEKKKEQRKGLMQKLLTGEVRLPGFNDEWNEERLEELCEKMKSGGTPKADNKSFYGGNIPFVKVNDMTTSGKYLFDTEQSITEEGLNSSSTWIVPKNNLLYSMYASVGFVSINKVEVATNQAIMAVVPNKKIELEFLYYSLVNYQQKLYRFIEKGTQGNLNAKLVKSIPISFPSIPEQKAITEILATSDREIHLLVKGLENLKEQKKGLMQLLLTGKVRVKG